jgi:hypothetical protein
MKISLPLALAALALTGSVALAADPIEQPKCVPGAVADAPERCTLPGYHWVKTTYYYGEHADARDAWMLLPVSYSTATDVGRPGRQ